jgi:hypothetical protein
MLCHGEVSLQRTHIQIHYRYSNNKTNTVRAEEFRAQLLTNVRSRLWRALTILLLSHLFVFTYVWKVYDVNSIKKDFVLCNY